MSDSPRTNKIGKLAICSSVSEIRWREQQEPGSFTRWHFDALSDDGREALIIVFHDNYALSPRYFGCRRRINDNSAAAIKIIPAVSLIYAVDGKTILRTVNEFTRQQFAAESEGIKCSIGDSSFHLETASYGSGFVLHVDLLTSRKRRIQAELEWLSVEINLSGRKEADATNSLLWNIAAPRSDVSGRLSLIDRREKVQRLIHFRGTGYHDHFQSYGSLLETVGSSFWGRAHFADSTAIFIYNELGNNEIRAKLFLVCEGEIHEHDVVQVGPGLIKTSRGIQISRRAILLSGKDVQLRIEPRKVIQTGFFEKGILCEMTLTLPDGKPRKIGGLTELLTPARMRSRLFRWLTDLRIGRNGRGPLY